jgi:hypothetical protein
MSTRGRVMNQEQLMKVKIKYLEERLNTLERSLASVIEHQFSNLNVELDKDQGFKDIDTKSKDNGNELI